MLILGIETSCDETAVAIVSEKGILSNLVHSQLEEHRPFGGVVPEIAARSHIEHLDSLIKRALDATQLRFSDLDGVAATAGPDSGEFLDRLNYLQVYNNQSYTKIRNINIINRKNNFWIIF